MVTSVCLQTPLTELYNDLGGVVRLFFGEVSVSAEKGDLCIVHSMDELGHLVRIGECSARRPLTPACSDPLLEKRLCKRAAKSCLYDALKAYTGQKPPWGSLTGIRPTRLFFEQLEQGKSMEEAERALCKTFDLDADKASLLRQIAQVQRALSMPKPGDIDVYVGIPFCTTRCTYCSFAATDLKHGGPLVDPYVEAVQREMRLCAPSLAGYRVRCIYIGPSRGAAGTGDRNGEGVLSLPGRIYGGGGPAGYHHAGNAENASGAWRGPRFRQPPDHER